MPKDDPPMRTAGISGEGAGSARWRGGPCVRGFTLIELMTTLTVLAILLMLAAPAFTSFVQSNRLRAAQSELVASLMLARGEAARIGKQVGVEAAQPAADGGFARGWRVWVDADANGHYDSGEDIVREVPALRSPLTIAATSDDAVFGPNGFLVPSSTVTFTLCGQNGVGKGYQVLLQPVGLSDITEVSTCP